MEAEAEHTSPKSKPSAITALLLRFALMTLTSDGPAAQPRNSPPAAWPRTQCATQKSRQFTHRRAQGPGGQCQKLTPLLHGPACPQGRVDQRDSQGAQAAGLS